MGERGVIRKIKFAKRWLEKAEEAYLQGKSDEGFLSLSLAEAEIRALHKGEWERALRLKKSSLRMILEVIVLTIILVLGAVSYTHVEEPPKSWVGGGVSFTYGATPVLGSFKELTLKISIPYVISEANLKGDIGLRKRKEFNAHIFYVAEKAQRKGPLRELKASEGAEEVALSPDEILRLIELGRKELKIYLTGGR